MSFCHRLTAFALASAAILLAAAMLAPPTVEAAPDSPPEIAVAIASFTSARRGVDLAEDGSV